MLRKNNKQNLAPCVDEEKGSSMLLNPVGNESYAYVLSLVEINLAYHNAAKNLIDSNPVESIFTPNIVGPKQRQQPSPSFQAARGRHRVYTKIDKNFQKKKLNKSSAD